ncbi:MAG: hypothetical protein JNL58_07905 [Planctomyces sp.]|nr:hypothetical protein [Planctomyces sp.]
MCLNAGRLCCLIFPVCILLLPGCGADNAELTSAHQMPATQSTQATSRPPEDAQQSSTQPEKPQAEKTEAEKTQAGSESSDAGAEDEFAPLAIGALGGRTASENSGAGGTDTDQEQSIQAIIERLRPLQVMLGKWRGTTRKEFDGFKAVDQHEWVWDLTSKPDQPALIMNSDKSPYLRTARLTWLPDKQLFRLDAQDPDGRARAFEGNYTDEVHEVVGSDDKLHKVFRLELNELPPAEAGSGGSEFLQFAFAQQESNRYLLEISQRRGKAAWRRVDTVSTQRDGTSFALSDTDYAERTCIISQGLGTMSITYKGRDYWVCCSGCRAAFEEAPDRWIARAAEMQKKSDGK